MILKFIILIVILGSFIGVVVKFIYNGEFFLKVVWNIDGKKSRVDIE